jgi:GGDEF domain-containing protein
MEEKISAENIRIPISHDGIHDSLTYLASSGLFYEILFRELSRASREQSSLLLFRFFLTFRKSTLTLKEVEEGLISFAQALTQSARLSDVSARVGQLEFLSLISIEEEMAEKFVNRIIKSREDCNLRFSYSYLKLAAHKSPLDILLQLDNADVIEV